MCNAAENDIHLTKEYYKDFLPTDLQWTVTEVDYDFTLYDLFRLVYQAEIMRKLNASLSGQKKWVLLNISFGNVLAVDGHRKEH